MKHCHPHHRHHFRHGDPSFFHHHREDHFSQHRERGRGGRGGGPGRFFESNDLRHVILHLIDAQPRHGYEIIKQIETLVGGASAPSPGIVYPTLTLLEEMGLAAVTAEGSRKLYAITDAGRQHLAESRTATDAILQRLQQAGERHNLERPPQVIRAMENLKMVLRMKAGTFSPDQLAAATDLIDAAAKQIERL